MENRYLGVITGDLYRSTAGLERGISYQNIMSLLRKKYYNQNDMILKVSNFFVETHFKYHAMTQHI